MSTSLAASEPPPSPLLSPKTFIECHDAYCRKQGTLRAHFLQVLRAQDNIGDEDTSPWGLPPRSSVIVTPQEVAEALQGLEGTAAAAAPPKSSTAFSTASTALSLVASPLKWTTNKMLSLVKDDDYDEEGELLWQQADDEGLGVDDDNHGTSFQDENDESGYGPMTPIVNLPHLQMAIQQLEEVINNHISLSFQGTTPIILGTSEWNTWVTSALEANSKNGVSFSTIPTSEKMFLLEVLEVTRVAKTVRRKEKTGSADLIVLYPASIIPKQEENSGELLEHLRVPIALWDLGAAENLIEKQIQVWSDKIDECNKQALKASQANKKSYALHFMRKRKHIQGEIHAASQKLVNIEHAKSAIESSQSNKMVMDVLAGSTNLLKNLRKEHSIDDVDDVLLDFQQELDDQKDMNDAMVASNELAMGGHISDEDLLKELEGLSLGDLEKNPTLPQSKLQTESLSGSDPIGLPVLQTSAKESTAPSVGAASSNLEKQAEAAS